MTPALVRTLVPLVVGPLVSILATWGIPVDGSGEAALVAGLTALFSALYFAAAHLLETRWPLASLLLGSTARPSYNGTDAKSTSGTGPATATPDTPEGQG